MNRHCISSFLIALTVSVALALCFTLFQGHAAMAADLGSSAKKVGRYMGDSAITTAVKSKFVAQKGLDSLDLHVVTQNGVVTLRGQVTSESQQQLAVKVAKETEGVRKVVNKISVMP